MKILKYICIHTKLAFEPHGVPTREERKELTLDEVMRQICLHYYKRLPTRFGPFLVKLEEGEEGKNPGYIWYLMSTGNLGNLILPW